MTSFRFLHAADIHLDSPLRGLASRGGEVAERIRTAPRRAFENLIDLAIEDRVAFLVIAGDLYDGDWRDYQTGLFFVQQMARLRDADIPAYVLHGNHDAASQLTRRLSLPDNVKTFSSRKAQTFYLDEFAVALHGQSFPKREVTDNMVPGYPKPRPGAFNIGILHTALEGGSEHANYAPCTLDELVHKGYDYWALGHVHQAKILHNQPHVVFPGNIQGRHIREPGAKGAVMVQVEDGVVAEAAPVYVDVVRWATVAVSIRHDDLYEEVMNKVRKELETAVDSHAEGRLLACRVKLGGRTGLHNRLLASTGDLVDEAQGLAAGIGDDRAWIEKVVVDTRPVLDRAARATREDALGELERLLRDAGQDAELHAQLASGLGEFTSKLPFGVDKEAEDPVLTAAVDHDYAKLIAPTVDYLMARIAEEDR